MNLSIIIPAYNEEKLIKDSLEKLLSFFKQRHGSFEIVVVDDGSIDDTANVVEKVSEDHEEVKLIKNPHKGKGFSIFSGVKKAAGEYLYLCDADLSTPIEEFNRLYDKMDEGYDVVIAVREGVGANRVGEPLYRHIMGRLFNFLVQLLVLRGFNDTQCGFKLFKGPVAKKIFSKLRLYSESAAKLKQAALTAYDVEVLFLARKLGFKIAEVPVLWEFRDVSRVNPIRDSWRNFWDVVRVKVNDMRGLYDL